MAEVAAKARQDQGQEGGALRTERAAGSGEVAPEALGIDGSATTAQLAEALNASPRVQALQRMEDRLAKGRCADCGAPLQTAPRGALPAAPAAAPPVQRAADRGGMPAELRAGLERMSGLDLSGTRVHYGSPEPAQLNAQAFARGQEIHLAPGQEQHLPHEAGHVVQQLQGRVRPTTEVAGVGVNDDPGLEREADRLGRQALRLGASAGGEAAAAPGAGGAAPPAVQRVVQLGRRGRGESTASYAVAEGKRRGPFSSYASSSSSTQLVPVDPSAASVAPPASAGGVVQRVITVGDVEYKELDPLFNKLFGSLKIRTNEEAEALEEVVRKLDAANRTFGSFPELLEEVQRLLEEDSDTDESSSDSDEVEFPLTLWKDEHGALKKKNLKEEGYRIGKSLRAGHGMDYKTVDKDAFKVQGHDELALVIRRNRPKGAGTMTQEYTTLKSLSKSMETAKILQYGHYPKGGVAYPAFLMKRYASSSKTLVRRKKKSTERVDDWKKNAAKVFDSRKKVDRGLESLRGFDSLIRKNPKLAVDDIQFLIDDDGSFVVNDASETGSKYQEGNLEVIDALMQVLKEWKGSLPKSDVGASSSSSPDESVVDEESILLEDEQDPDSRSGWIDLGGGYYLPDYRGGVQLGDDTGSFADFHRSRKD